MRPVEPNLQGNDETLDNVTRLDSGGYEFTYYPQSGGLVISQGPTPIDAGVIGTPGPITRARLGAIAQDWHVWRRYWRLESARVRVQMSNRPTDRET